MSEGRGFKIKNTYIRIFEDDYENIPKAVFAAIAVSFAHLLEEDSTPNALNRFYDEWRILHGNGIIPQKPILKKKVVANE